MVAVLSIAAAAVICLSGLAVYTVYARENRSAYKYYTCIEVSQGQSLWSIADEYMSKEYSSRYDYIREVARLNHLSDTDEIHAGGYLTIPYYSSENLH